MFAFQKSWNTNHWLVPVIKFTSPSVPVLKQCQSVICISTFLKYKHNFSLSLESVWREIWLQSFPMSKRRQCTMFRYFYRLCRPCSFEDIIAPFSVSKNSKINPLSWISNFHALITYRMKFISHVKYLLITKLFQ